MREGEAREGAGRGEEVVSTILCKGGGRGGEPRAGPRAGTGAVCSGRRARASMLWECGRLRGLEMRAGLACCGKGSCIEAKREGRDMFARRRDTKVPWEGLVYYSCEKGFCLRAAGRRKGFKSYMKGYLLHDESM